MSKNTNIEINEENAKEIAEQILNEAREEAAKIIADVKGEATKILNKARKEVENFGTNTYAVDNSSGLSEDELSEIKRNEEYIEIKLFKDNEKYADDVYVAVGNDNCVIKRGVPVKIKRKFYLVLTQQEEQDIKTSRLIEEESENYKKL